MKKFLSLVLALIMAMSLVTISAGATEYKDFTDKDEIQYEEAVAVLNRLGIITGYSEGDFRPEGVLTRGAAAKIIVSLLIGPEAAGNLVVSQAPYSDVPVDHTFASVISYCKTAGIISGYGDGSFKPGAPLTGYAFSKMLMGALGYKANLEGFVGSGWTMQVAAKGNAAGLFDHISFKGNEAVTREQACQLALNTLKATMVEYSGGFTVSAGEATVQGAQTRSYKVSNQEFASHINNKKAGGNANYDKDNWYTVEFGEEHFVDLRMEQEAASLDQFGRPSNVWSYKKVTIGTFPIAPDYSYTTQVIRSDDKDVTAAAKERALGLSNFDYLSGKDGDQNRVAGRVFLNGYEQARLTDVADIADWTDNGTLVEVYIDEDDADWIRYVVVIQTQLMEVKRIASDYVTLSLYDGGSDDSQLGYNSAHALDVNVNDVDAGDDCYAFLKDLKAGDIVAVVPVAEDHDINRYEVAEAYTPETVSGELTGVQAFNNTTNTNDTGEAVTVTVGGTKYNIARWNKDLKDINGDSIKVTYGDVKLHLDKYGNAMLAEDVGETSDYMIVGEFYKTLVNNRQVTIASGWDISGNKLELNLGTGTNTQLGIQDGATTIQPGDLVYYSNVDVPTNAEWRLYEDGDHGIFGVETEWDITQAGAQATDMMIHANDVKIRLKDDASTTLANAGHTNAEVYIDKGIKFIYVSFDDVGNVDSIEIVNGVQNTTRKELNKALDGSALNGTLTDTADGTYESVGYNTAQACVSLKGDDKEVTDKSAIKAVVVKNDTTSVSTTDVLYVRDRLYSVDKVNGENVYTYKVAMRNADGIVSEEMEVKSTDVLAAGDFARYAKATKEGVDGDNFYSLKKIDIRGKNTSSAKMNFVNVVNANNGLLEVGSYGHFGNSDLANMEIDDAHGVGDIVNTIKTAKNGKTTVWVDLTGNRWDSADDLEDALDPDEMGGVWSGIKLSIVYNDNPDNDNFRTVSMIVITDAVKPGAGADAQPRTLNIKVATGGNVTSTVIRADGSAGTGVNLNGPTTSAVVLKQGERVEVVINDQPAGKIADVDYQRNVANAAAATGALTPSASGKYVVNFSDLTSDASLTGSNKNWMDIDFGDEPDALAITVATDVEPETDLDGVYLTVDGANYTLGDEIEVDSKGVINVSALDGVEGGVLGLADGTNTTVKKIGSSWRVTLTDKEQPGTVKVTFEATYTVKALKAALLANYDIKSATVGGDAKTKAEILAGVTGVKEGDTVVITMVQTAGNGAPFSVTGNGSVTFNEAADNVAGTDAAVARTKDGVAEVEAAYSAAQTVSDQASLGALITKLGDGTSKDEKCYKLKTGETTASASTLDEVPGITKTTDATTYASATHDGDYYLLTTAHADETLGELTITFKVGAGDCQIDSFALA